MDLDVGYRIFNEIFSPCNKPPTDSHLFSLFFGFLEFFVEKLSYFYLKYGATNIERIFS